MSYDKSVSDHYTHGNLLSAIEAALPALGKTTETVTASDLAPIDEFHIGGRAATEHLLKKLGFENGAHLLDIGCGLGGAARHVAETFDFKVTGIDLTPEYIETGRILCHWLNLDNRVTLEHGSALAMPFQDQFFDGSYMLHVGMNIDEKLKLFAEVYRVLKPGSTFGIYDLMGQRTDEMLYPVPWATTCATSKLSTIEQYQQSLSEARFEVLEVTNRSEFALEFFAAARKKADASSNGPPPLGLHTLMQNSTESKVENLVKNFASGHLTLVEMVARKGENRV